MDCHTGAFPTASAGTNHVEAKGPLGMVAFSDPNGTTGGTPAASPFIVPAASGTSPGTAYVFIARSSSAPRQTTITSGDFRSDVDPTKTRTSYQIWLGDYWVFSQSVCGVNPKTGLEQLVDTWTGTRNWTYLSAAKSVITGSFSVTTQGWTGSSAYADSRTVISGQSFNRTINQ